METFYIIFNNLISGHPHKDKRCFFFSLYECIIGCGRRFIYESEIWTALNIYNMFLEKKKKK